jgi:hypothetical protein
MIGDKIKSLNTSLKREKHIKIKYVESVPDSEHLAMRR